MEVVIGSGGKLYSQNLRDFLSIKEEDHHRNLNASTSSSSGGGRRNSTGLTLSAVLSEKGGHPAPVDEPPLQRIQSNRTLLDIIREDQPPGLDRANADGRSSWRHLKDKIRLRRRGTGAAWSSDVPLRNNSHRITTISTRQHPVRFNSNTDSGESTQTGGSAPSSHRSPSRLPDAASGRFQQTISLALRRSISEDNRQGNEEERGRDTAEAAPEGDGSPEHPVRTSLMTLLAENDRQMGFEGSAYVEGGEEAVEETGGTAAATGGASGVEYNNCCVCMVRHKGAAFIPCGHTFCRLCSRELWVQRGNCPLCNNHILEILDIF